MEAHLPAAGKVAQLAGIAVAAADNGKLPKSVQALTSGVTASDAQKRIAESLAKGDHSQVLLGLIAARHPASSALWALASAAAINGAQSAESAGPYPPGPGNRVLGATDLVIFEQAHRAGDRNDWRAARRLATQSSDEIAARVVEWR